MSQAEDVWPPGDVENSSEDQQHNFSDISAILGNSRHQILAAQYECYLKIIHDPPRTDDGESIVTIVPFTHRSTDKTHPAGIVISLMVLTRFGSGKCQIKMLIIVYSFNKIMCKFNRLHHK